MKLSAKQMAIDYGFIVVGAFIMAAAYVLFINPYNIVPGGVFGIGIVVHHIFPFIPVGMFGLAMNIPLTLLGIKILGPKFGFKTVLGMVLASGMMDILTYFIGSDDPLGLADELLLSCIFGAILIGLGLGMIFKARATSGGSDIIAMIIAKYSSISVGQLLVLVDSCIVFVGLIVFQDWKIPLFSWLTIYITGQVIDVVLKGVSYDYAVMIVSDKHAEIKKYILENLNRGGTYLKGEGMYTGNEKNVIFVVVSRREVSALKQTIYLVDPNAFITVISTSEILGEGFKPLKAQN